jgi:undecaprenyl-diphosphatase
MSDELPGQQRFGAGVAGFDRLGERAADTLRGNPVADRVFVAASTIGDFSIIWHLVNIGRGLVWRRRPDQAVVLAVALGVESLIVNQGLKRIFRRQRPTMSGHGEMSVRRPSTSAFPSGHASAAVFNAVILSRWDRRLAVLWWTLAAVVAVSRVHVRIHHPSDVVGGAVAGAVMGRLVLAVIKRFD